MSEIDVQEFEARLDSMECSEALWEIVASLRNAAQRDDPADVSLRHIRRRGAAGESHTRGERRCSASSIQSLRRTMSAHPS